MWGIEIYVVLVSASKLAWFLCGWSKLISVRCAGRKCFIIVSAWVEIDLVLVWVSEIELGNVLGS